MSTEVNWERNIFQNQQGLSFLIYTNRSLGGPRVTSSQGDGRHKMAVSIAEAGPGGHSVQ